MSPFFVLVGFGERLDECHIPFASVLVLRGAIDCPRGLSSVPPLRVPVIF